MIGSGDIKRAIQKIANGKAEIYCKVCIVDAVDETQRTIDCTPVDESAPLIGVNLQANQSETKGIFVVPKVGSYVVVGFLSDATAVVLLTMNITKVVVVTDETFTFNDGKLGGLINIADLTSKINGLVDSINALVNAYNTHTHVVATTGTAVAQSGTATATAATTQTAEHFKKGDYEDAKIVH